MAHPISGASQPNRWGNQSAILAEIRALRVAAEAAAASARASVARTDARIAEFARALSASPLPPMPGWRRGVTFSAGGGIVGYLIASKLSQYYAAHIQKKYGAQVALRLQQDVNILPLLGVVVGMNLGMVLNLAVPVHVSNRV